MMADPAYQEVSQSHRTMARQSAEARNSAAPYSPAPELHRPSASKDSSPGAFSIGNTVKTVFGQCAGIVDVASFVLHTCRGQSDDDLNRRTDGANPTNHMNLTNSSRKARKRQGDTLVYPNKDGFDDDVSALSANTLEEMERFTKHMARQGKGQPAHGDVKKPFPGQQLVPPPRPTTQLNRDWTNSVPRATSNTDLSLGVSTSGSGSTEEEHPGPTRGGHRSKKGMQVFQAQVDF